MFSDGVVWLEQLNERQWVLYSALNLGPNLVYYLESLLIVSFSLHSQKWI